MAAQRLLKKCFATVALYSSWCGVGPDPHGDPCWVFEHPEVRLVGASAPSRRFELGVGEQVQVELTRVCESTVVGTWSVLDSTVARLTSAPSQRAAGVQLIGIAPGTTRVFVSGLTAADPEVVVAPQTIEADIIVVAR